MSLFGQASTNNQQQTGGLFGSLSQNIQQSASPFGTLNQTSGQNTQPLLFGNSAQISTQQNGGMFGSAFGQNNNNNAQQQQGTGMFSGLQQQNQQNQQQGGGLFGSLNQSAPAPSQNLFGSNQQTPGQNIGMFGAALGQPQQPQAQQQNGLGGFGQSALGQSQRVSLADSQLWQPLQPTTNTIPEQVKTIVDKWDTGNPNCVFRHYFYNKVDENKAPYYRPGPNEDAKAWEDALSKKPGKGYIPVLCIGFTQLGERIQIQQRNLASFNQRLHEINSSLDAMQGRHDVIISVRTMDAKRRHNLLKQRCMHLATKVQILRNRGYAMSGDEEDLKGKLQSLERGICDPGLSARGEEIWARMVGLREGARLLKEEMGRRTDANGEVLDEATARRAQKILEDYKKQLDHLDDEVQKVTREFRDHENNQPPQSKR